MERREFIKAALAVTLAPVAVGAQSQTPAVPKTTTIAPGPLPWMSGLDRGDLAPVTTVNVDEVAQTKAVFFQPSQMATLVRLSAVLLPPLNGHPGAIEAEVPQFLDFFVSKASIEVRRIYQSGLDDLHSVAKHQYGKSFAELSDAQIDGILKPRLATWMPDHYPESADKRFVNIAHHDIRTATQNSPAWAKAAMAAGKRPYYREVYWRPIDPDITRTLTGPVLTSMRREISDMHSQTLKEHPGK